MRGFNVDPKDLEGILAALRQLEDERVYKDATSWLLSLQTFADRRVEAPSSSAGARQVESGDRGGACSLDRTPCPISSKTMVQYTYRSLGKTAAAK